MFVLWRGAHWGAYSTVACWSFWRPEGNFITQSCWSACSIYMRSISGIEMPLLDITTLFWWKWGQTHWQLKQNKELSPWASYTLSFINHLITFWSCPYDYIKRHRSWVLLLSWRGTHTSFQNCHGWFIGCNGMWCSACRGLLTSAIQEKKKTSKKTSKALLMWEVTHPSEFRGIKQCSLEGEMLGQGGCRAVHPYYGLGDLMHCKGFVCALIQLQAQEAAWVHRLFFPCSPFIQIQNFSLTSPSPTEHCPLPAFSFSLCQPHPCTDSS